MQNLDATVISQYGNSPVLTGLIARLGAAVGPSTLFEMFYDYIWDALDPDNPNPAPSPSYGLDVWGRIVVQPRTLKLAAYAPFGWGEAGDRVGWGQGPWDDSPPGNTTYILQDDLYRLAILAKAATNITGGGVQDINSILMTLFSGRGNCYVVDNLDMTMTYTFQFPLTDTEQALVQSGILPTPGGVSASFDFAGNQFTGNVTLPSITASGTL